jgi:hypothetical protein
MQSPVARSVRSRLTRLAATVALVAAGLVPLAASAVPITVPTGLSPGQQYRLAFITSTTRDATSSNIADYNAFVTNAANAVPELVALGTTWTAIGSTLTVAARDNTATNPGVNGTGVPIYFLNDTILADDYADLWDGSIDNNFDVNEFGTHVASTVIWTGTNSNGTSTPSYLGDIAVGYGVSNQSDPSWIVNGQLVSGTSRPLYAISGTVTVVPEPNTAALLALGLTVWALLARRHRGSWNPPTTALPTSARGK